MINAHNCHILGVAPAHALKQESRPLFEHYPSSHCPFPGQMLWSQTHDECHNVADGYLHKSLPLCNKGTPESASSLLCLFVALFDEANPLTIRAAQPTPFHRQLTESNHWSRPSSFLQIDWLRMTIVEIYPYIAVFYHLVTPLPTIQNHAMHYQ